MKTSLRTIVQSTSVLFFLPLLITLFFVAGCSHLPDDHPTLHITTVATGLNLPMGIETDANGNIWVCETGTAANDGKVVVVKPTGEVYDAVVHLSSIHNAVTGEAEGPAHLLLDNGTLYILAANYLYKVNVAHFMPGDTPVDATTLSYEDIGSWVLTYPFVNNAHDTHPYNLTKGPDGDLYIADAGANAIIHRKGAGNYSILAEVPGIANPTPVGPPVIQSVPTSIMYDGHNFLVTTLLGFPFPAGMALIYNVSMSGNVSTYQQGFTSLVDLAKGDYFGHIALQYGTFGLKGWDANTGALVWTNGTSMHQLAGGLNMPVGIKQLNIRAWYISSMGDGTLLKAAYY